MLHGTHTIVAVIKLMSLFLGTTQPSCTCNSILSNHGHFSSDEQFEFPFGYAESCFNDRGPNHSKF